LQADFCRHFSDAQVDCSTAADAPALVNAWVAAQTGGKIQDILQQPPDGLGMMLTTAFDFDGKWQTPFSSENTVEDTFFVTPHESLQASFMARFDTFHYCATEQGQMVRLPYQKDQLVMTIFLPRPELSLDDWLQQSNSQDWRAAIQALQPREGSVYLPRVNAGFSETLNACLKTLGLRRAFTDEAQFTGIVQDARLPLQISQVRHTTRLEINEEGTRAAAVTVIEMIGSAVPDDDAPPPFAMKIDRPFFLTIGTASNHEILFMGAVRHPSKAENRMPHRVFAICIRCGAEIKRDACHCETCGFEPQTDAEKAKFCLLSRENEWLLMPVQETPPEDMPFRLRTEDELKAIAEAIRGGTPYVFDANEVRAITLLLKRAKSPGLLHRLVMWLLKLFVPAIIGFLVLFFMLYLATRI
ncbi:MAG: hypothetical protein LBS89_01875, partial [Zoogloeaceae bacterium]|nr:hypothetical protein [Zoogloeaceae bacterium]